MRARAGIWLKWAMRLVLVLLLVILIGLGSLLFSGIRGRALNAGMKKVLGNLPGQVTGTWTWPGLNRIEGRGIVWVTGSGGTAGADTLAVVESIALRWDLSALRDREMRIEEGRVRISVWDIPATMTALTPAGSDVQETKPPSRIPYLKPGSIPGLPALGIDLLSVSGIRLAMPGNVVVDDLALEGAADMFPGSRPHAEIRSMGGRCRSLVDPAWIVDVANLRGGVSYDPATGAVSLDSVVGDVPRVVYPGDGLEFRAGPLSFSASGGLNEGIADGAGWLRFQAEVPASLQNPVQGLEFRALSGRADVRVVGSSGDLRLEGSLDLDPTEDLSSGRLAGAVRLAAQPRTEVMSARIDTLDLRWRQARLFAAGDWSAGQVDASVAADLGNLELPLLFMPALSGVVDGRVRFAGRVEGPMLSPRMTGTFHASCDIDSLGALPGLAEAAHGLPVDLVNGEFRRVSADMTGKVDGTGQSLGLDLRLDLGRTAWLDRGLLSGRLLAGPRDAALKALRLDTLAVAMIGADVWASGFLDTARVDLTGTARFDGSGVPQRILAALYPGLDLGAEADIRVSGPWGGLDGGAHITGRVAAEKFEVPEFRADLSVRDGKVQAEAGMRGGVRLGGARLDSLWASWQGEAGGLSQAPAGAFDLTVWGSRAEGHVRGRTAGDSLRVISLDTLVMTAGGKTLHSAGPVSLVRGPGPLDLDLGGLSILGEFGRVDLGAASGAGRLDAHTAVDLSLPGPWLDTLFPSPFWSAGGGIDLEVTGKAGYSQALAPTVGETPRFQGQAGLRLIPGNGDPAARLDGRFRLAGGDTAALSASVEMSVGETRLLHGSGYWPGTVDMTTGLWTPGDRAAGDLHIPEQELPLDFINRFLPGEVTLKGTVIAGADLEAAGAADVPAQGPGDRALKGLILTKGLKIGLPNLSRMEVDGELGLGGRLIDPRLEGRVTVTSGLYRLPEIPRSLFPVSGKSILWDAGAVEGEETRWKGPEAMAEERSAYIPDLDIRVVIPGNFHITGYGLETELAGDVKVSRGWARDGSPAPALRGQIHTVEGELRAMNRTFDIERGELGFEGKVPADPRLDILMVTEIEGTAIRIKVTGTALKPEIVLESDPEMTQPDIMAVLVFGRPVGELDSEQQDNLSDQVSPVQQVKQNIQDLAMVFGSAEIQKSVSGKIGLDQIRLGSGKSGSSLILGKFLNPKMLIKYQQSLVRSGTYNMTVEYTLNRLLRLISTYGHEEASGLELRWQRRY